MVRYKSPSNQYFHFLLWHYWPFSTPSPPNHVLIPLNQCVIRKFNDYKFHLFHLQIAMTIENPIPFFSPAPNTPRDHFYLEK
jgi:hypothetical protein